LDKKQESELLRKKPPAPSVKVRKNARIVVIKRRRRLKFRRTMTRGSMLHSTFTKSGHLAPH
jgi:hypothetical protein